MVRAAVVRRWSARVMVGLSVIFLTALGASPAFAWGDEGHRVVATIARSYLKRVARARVDALLASDPDTLTAPDMASRATWADKWRDSGHRETASWHFVDTELDAPDLAQACFGNPPPAAPASAGPAQDCVVNKIREFSAELASPATTPTERVLALKYLLHFVGDLHQPLHASDNHDRGGNCVLVALDSGRTVKLHAYWDTNLVVELGSDPVTLSASLIGQITPAQEAQWRSGTPADWAMEAFQVARATAFRLGSAPGCPASPSPIALTADYDAAARTAATLQLQRAGVRLAAVLNDALGGMISSPARVALERSSAITTNAPAVISRASLACSAKAKRLHLHGPMRRAFRQHCMV